MMDVYNAYFLNMTVEGDRPGERKFKKLNNAYYVDNTDIMDPIWDGATDYNHPCERGFRPMVYRKILRQRKSLKKNNEPLDKTLDSFYQFTWKTKWWK